MTGHIDRDELTPEARSALSRRADAALTGYGDSRTFVDPLTLRALLDALDQAEARITDLTQEVRDERGAALDQIEQVNIRDARIADALGYCGLVDEHPYLNTHPGFVAVADIRRALDGDSTNRK